MKRQVWQNILVSFLLVVALASVDTRCCEAAVESQYEATAGDFDQGADELATDWLTRLFRFFEDTLPIDPNGHTSVISIWNH